MTAANMPLTISSVNTMDCEDFIEVFGNVIDNCKFIAALVWRPSGFKDINDLHDEICRVLDNLPTEVKVGIARCFSELAGRLADQGALSRESEKEQKSAGLNLLSAADKQRLREYNAAYRKKFGFPFIICARMNKKQAIMGGIAQRLNNDVHSEVTAAMEEIKKISYLRLTNILGQPVSRSKY